MGEARNREPTKKKTRWQKARRPLYLPFQGVRTPTISNHPIMLIILETTKHMHQLIGWTGCRDDTQETFAVPKLEQSKGITWIVVRCVVRGLI